MSVTKATIQSLFASARTAFAGALVTIRHDGRTYSGTRLPTDRGEQVDEEGAIFTVTGGVRLLTSELAREWPQPGDKIEIESTETGEWETFIVVGTRPDEMEATLMLTYGERYDQRGVI